VVPYRFAGTSKKKTPLKCGASLQVWRMSEQLEDPVWKAVQPAFHDREYGKSRPSYVMAVTRIAISKELAR